MDPLQQFRWTERSDVCEQLLRFIQKARDDPPAEREDGSFAEPDPGRAQTLFCLLADEPSIPALRKMLMDGNESKSARVSALRALVRLKADLHERDLDSLLHDRSPQDDEGQEGGLDEVLRLCRTEEAQCLVRDHLEQLAPRERARLLLKIEDSHHPYYRLTEKVAPELVDWLYEQWLYQDRHRLDGSQDAEGPLNLQVAVETRRRAESRPLVIDYWRCAGPEPRSELLERLRHDWVFEERNRARRAAEWWQQQRQEAIYDEELRAVCAASDPVVYQALAETLDLPHDHLILHFGSEPLLLRIEERLREASHKLRADRSSYKTVYPPEFRRVFQVLMRWPGSDLDSRISSLYLSPDLDSSVQRNLGRVIWDRLCRDDPAQAMVVAQAEPTCCGTYFRAHSLLLWTSDDPQLEDREFLMWASAQKDVQCRYQALQALEKLDEQCLEWQTSLRELAEDSNVFVRLDALAALSRRGDEICHAEVTRQATTDADVRVRGEAIRLLGELDAERHLALFIQACLEDHEAAEFRFTPASEESALALARLGTPEALTALIQAFLIAPEQLFLALHWYFELMDPPGSPCPDLQIYPYLNWRKAGAPYWLRS